MTKLIRAFDISFARKRILPNLHSPYGWKEHVDYSRHSVKGSCCNCFHICILTVTLRGHMCGINSSCYKFAEVLCLCFLHRSGLVTQFHKNYMITFKEGINMKISCVSSLGPPLSWPNWHEWEQRCYWNNLIAGYYLNSEVYSPPFQNDLLSGFHLSSLHFYNRKLIHTLDAILSQGQQQLLCTCLKCLFSSTHFWPFWILLSVPAHFW